MDENIDMKNNKIGLNFKKTILTVVAAGLMLTNVFNAFPVAAQNTTDQGKNQPLPTVAGRDMTEDIKRNKKALAVKRQELSELKNRSQKLKDELAKLQSDKDGAMAEKERIANQLEYAQETLKQRLQEQEKAHQTLVNKQDEYEKRLAAMFYYRQRSWWEILLDSHGLSGFFSNIRMISAIATTDANMITELKHTEEVAAEAGKLAEKTAQEYVGFLKDKEAELENLQQGIVDATGKNHELSAVLQQRGTEEQDLARTLAEQEAAQAMYVANSKALAAKIAKLEEQKAQAAKKAQQARQNNNQIGNQIGNQSSPQNGNDGSFIIGGNNTPALSATANSLAGGSLPGYHGKPVWPLPNFTEISSPYGWRNMSFDAGNGYLHTGTDISGPNAGGAPVVAAWTGVVVTANAPYQGSMYAPQANYVQINHGNGLGSGYWHLLDVTVSVGQVVQAGEVIGHCGSTGMSTGPHLHFEVYDANNPRRQLRNTVDPMEYLR